MDKKLSSVPWLIIIVFIFVLISGSTQRRAFAFTQVNALGDYPLHPGFPINLNIWIEKGAPTIADINNDGSNELLVPGWNGQVYGLDASGARIPGFPLSPGGQIQGRLALGDLNSDHQLEIAAGVESSTKGVAPLIYIWKADGSLLDGWPQNTHCYRSDRLCLVSSISIADIDQDGNPEVIASTTNTDITNSDPSLYIPNLYVWHNNGQVVEGSWPAEDRFNCGIFGAVAVGDLNRDNKLEIATGLDDQRLFEYDYLGNLLPGWDKKVYVPDPGNYHDPQIEFGRSAVSLADLDKDGVLEYIVPGLLSHGVDDYYSPALLVLGPDGKRKPGWELPALGNSLLSDMSWRMIQAPAVGDINRDYYPDIVLSTQDGWVRAYTANKVLLWSFDYAQGMLVYASETVIGDVNGDGWNEVVFGTFDPNYGNAGPVGVWILDHNGLPLPGSPMVVHAPGITSAPTLADLDGDGYIEITATSSFGEVYVWDTPGVFDPDRLPWPMARHDLQRTGSYVVLTPNFNRSYKIPSDYTPQPGEIVTFTATLIQSATPINETIQFTNTLPGGLSYIPGSLTASSGMVDDSQLPTLRWSGSMFEKSEVLISYSTIVAKEAPVVITDTSLVDAGIAGDFELSSTLIINGQQLYIPVIRR
jgi:uncharacterized repeat protein (TIGR01451 family)